MNRSISVRIIRSSRILTVCLAWVYHVRRELRRICAKGVEEAGNLGFNAGHLVPWNKGYWFRWRSRIITTITAVAGVGWGKW